MTDQEYFTVHHNLTINIEVLPQHFVIPDNESFVAEIPTPFIVASECSHLDMMADNTSLELKSKEFKHLIHLLETQNKKLNLLLGFMLAQQDDASIRFKTTQFGASQLTYQTEQPLEVNQLVRVKLFLDHPASAIFCYAQVSEIQIQSDMYLITLKYKMLRDEDQDLLIKAALYQQQKLLRQRSLERDSK